MILKKQLYYILLLSYALTTQAQEWSLKQVIQTALKTSLSFQEIQKKIDSDELTLIPALVPYDWTLGTQLNYPRNEWTKKQKNTYWMSSAFIQKNYTLGTTLRFKYFNNYNLPIPSLASPTPVRKGTSSPLYTQGIVFEAEQNILRNFFGRESRLKLKSAQYRLQGIQLSRKQELKQLVMESAQKFWDTYIAYTQLKQSQKRTKDYKELVRIAQKKKSLGHSQPGEVPQMLSQYEQAIQTQNQIENMFKNSKTQLKTFLQVDNKNFTFKTHKSSALPKKQNPSDMEATQTLQMAKAHKMSQIAQLESQKYYYLPYLKFKIQSSMEGSSNSFKKTYNALQDSSPQYFIGFELAYPIPASLTGFKQFKYLSAKKKEHEIHYQKQKENFQDQIQTSWNNVKSSHQSMLAASKIEKLQKQALAEIRKSYIQGRVPINVLLSAQDRTAQVELAKIQAQKHYSLSLLQFYALRDQLLSQYTP